MTDSESTALVTVAEAPPARIPAVAGMLTERQILDRLQTVAEVLAPDAKLTPPELQLFAMVAARNGLDPFAKQIYAIRRLGKLTFQTGIDGYRSTAARTGEYMGSEPPVFGQIIEPDEAQKRANWKRHPESATVTVRRRLPDGTMINQSATAWWDEYVPGPPNDFRWKQAPRAQLAKCFDEDTEVLTDRGFQRFSEVTGRVLQVTDRGLEPVDAVPFSQPWSGQMVTLESDDLNFAVTPNHDMVTTEGRVEAGTLYLRAKTKPRAWIPRSIAGTRDDAPVSDAELVLCAGYLADGFDRNRGFAISVSRPRKVEELRALGLHSREDVRRMAGRVARSTTSVRTVTARSDQALFIYPSPDSLYLCSSGKRARIERILTLSRRQARVLVDAWVRFDGSANSRTGVRRFYSTRPDHMEAFEVAAVAAGYAVSPRRSRTSDLSSRPNFNVTISGRSEIPVIRWGASHSRSTANAGGRTGLEMRPNTSGRVWCVTVPSGEIIVRRHGFSMRCGNCAEALALRMMFPYVLADVYVEQEMDHVDSAAARAAEQARIAALPTAADRAGERRAALEGGGRGRQARRPQGDEDAGDPGPAAPARPQQAVRPPAPIEPSPPATSDATRAVAGQVVEVVRPEHCMWRLGQGAGRPALGCGQDPGHAGDHDWQPIASATGGRVIRPDDLA